MKKIALLSSIVTILLCLSLIAGSTFALFTSTSKVNVAVTAGNVDVVASIDQTLKTWSLGQTEADATNGTFVNGGTAVVNNEGELVISRMTPGDVVKFTINVTNNSNVAIQYRVKATSTIGGATVDLSDALTTTATIGGVEYKMEKNAKSFETPYVEVEATNGVGGSITSITVVVVFPNGNPDNTLDNAGNVIEYGDNHYQNAEAKIAFTVEAVQGNGVDANGDLITN